MDGGVIYNDFSRRTQEGMSREGKRTVGLRVGW